MVPSLTKRAMRLVDEDIWRLSELSSERRARLLQPLDPVALLNQVAVDAQSAAAGGTIKLQWQRSDDFPGYSRLVAKVPLKEETFDQLFNGRSGYRAQYYLSPEEGVLYNRDLLAILLPALMQALIAAPLGVDEVLVRRSLAGPHAKVWVFEEKQAFDEAPSDTLNPPRWFDNKAIPGRRAPLPEHLSIEVKGVFIHPQKLDFRVYEYKLDRACDLFNKGYT
jgi:hypothetical protein